jgi:hypothetical protein
VKSAPTIISSAQATTNPTLIKGDPQFIYQKMAKINTNYQSTIQRHHPNNRNNSEFSKTSINHRIIQATNPNLA